MSGDKKKKASWAKQVSDEESNLLSVFAVQPGLFSQPEGTEPRERLKGVVEEHWASVKQDIERRSTYLFLLVMHCPPLLDRQPAFEWVADEYKMMWYRALWTPSYQSAVRDASALAFEERRREALPTSLHTDYARAHRVKDGLAAGMNISWAEQQAAAAERSRKKDVEMVDPKTVHTSTQRVMKKGNWDESPGLIRGGTGFLDRGISGFLAGHNRRNEIHEEAQT